MPPLQVTGPWKNSHWSTQLRLEDRFPLFQFKLAHRILVRYFGVILFFQGLDQKQ